MFLSSEDRDPGVPSTTACTLGLALISGELTSHVYIKPRFPPQEGRGKLHTVVCVYNRVSHAPVWLSQVCPTNRSNAREDATDVVFKTELSKWNAVSAEIKRIHKTGRPVLVGTTSVERSEFLAGLLTKEGIPFQLLNAKPEFVEKESEIIAQSGRKGQVRD
jgi:preprotein translocase subunit SecA